MSTVTLRVKNSEGTSVTAHARLLIENTNGIGGGGDPYIHFDDKVNTEDWSIGADASDNGKLKISNSATIEIAPIIIIDPATTFVGIGTDTPDAALDIEKNTSITQSMRIRQIGTGNVNLTLQADGGGDPYIHFDDNTTPTNWSIGIDISNNGEFKIGNTITPITTAIININPTTTNVGIGISAPDEKLQVAGNVHVDDDDKMIFGTGKDAEISYDATDLVVKPDAVGAGKFKIDGDINVVAAHDYYHAGVQGHTETIVFDDNAGVTHTMVFSGGILTSHTAV